MNERLRFFKQNTKESRRELNIEIQSYLSYMYIYNEYLNYIL